MRLEKRLMISSCSVLYNQIINAYTLSPCSLCLLHKPCKINSECLQIQNTLVLDFDSVKDAFSKANKIPTGASVDALCLKNETFIFVEIKGWKLFLVHQVPVTKEKIEKQIEKYDFGNKLLNSLRICCTEAKNDSFFDGKTIQYLIITDINIKENPLEVFAMNLSALSTTSSSLEEICNESMKNYLSMRKNSWKLNNTAVRTYYKTCRDFDSFVNGIEDV